MGAPRTSPVRGRPLVRPEHLTGPFVHGERPLGTIHGARLGIFHPVGDEDTTVGHRGSRVPHVDRDAPRDLELVGKLVDDPGLLPDAEPIDPTPLMPVVGARPGAHDEQRARSHAHHMSTHAITSFKNRHTTTGNIRSRSYCGSGPVLPVLPHRVRGCFGAFIDRTGRPHRSRDRSARSIPRLRRRREAPSGSGRHTV